MFRNCGCQNKTPREGDKNRELKSRSCLREEAETQPCCCSVPRAVGRAGDLPQAGSQSWLGAGGPCATSWLWLREGRAQHPGEPLMDTHPTGTHRGENTGTAGTGWAAESPEILQLWGRCPVRITLCSEVVEALVGWRFGPRFPSLPVIPGFRFPGPFLYSPKSFAEELCRKTILKQKPKKRDPFNASFTELQSSSPETHLQFSPADVSNP